MDRIKLLDLLYRRRQTVDYSNSPISFLEFRNKPWQFSNGVPTEVDGDALAILRKAVTA